MGINFILVYRQLSLKKITYSRLSLLIVLLKPSHHCLLFSYTPKQNKKVFLITYSKLLLWYVQHRSCNQTTVRIQNNPITPKISWYPKSHSLPTPNVLFQSSLLFSKISSKWKYRICNLLRQAFFFFTSDNTFKIHSSWCIYQPFISLYLWRAFHHMDVLQIVYLLTNWKIFG